MAQDRLHLNHFSNPFVPTKLYMVTELEAQIGVLLTNSFGVFKERKERSRSKEEEEEQELGLLGKLYLYHLPTTMLYMVTELDAQIGVLTNLLFDVFKERRQEMSRREEEQVLGLVAPSAMAQNRLYLYHTYPFVPTMLYMYMVTELEDQLGVLTMTELEAQIGVLTNSLFGVFKEERRQERSRRKEEQELGLVAPSAMAQNRLDLYHLPNLFVPTMLYMATELEDQFEVCANSLFGVYKERRQERSRNLFVLLANFTLTMSSQSRLFGTSCRNRGGLTTTSW